MKRVLLALLLAIAAPATAAEPGRLEAGQVLRGRFVQERVLKGFSTPLRSDGMFLVAPGRGLIWRSETPFAVTTVMTTAGVLQEANGAEMTRLPASRAPFLSKFYAMLMATLAGDWAEIESVFKVERQPGPERWQVVLTPLRRDDAAIPIGRITVAGGRFVEAIEIDKTAGDSERLAFSGHEISSRPPDDAEAKLLGALSRP